MRRVLIGAGLLLGFASTILAQARGTSILVSRSFYGDQTLAVSGRGDFILAWSAVDDRSSSRGVFVRLFEADGTPKGPAFRAHEQIFGDQRSPSVAADQEGNFIVAWEGGKALTGTNAWPGGDGDRTGVYIQSFDRTGQRVGRQIQVNRQTQGYQLDPQAAISRTGSFIVAWRDCPQQVEHCWILAQAFSAGGLRKGRPASMQVAGLLSNNSVYRIFPTADPSGFSVGWTEYIELGGYHYNEVFPVVQRVAPSGRPAEHVFRLRDGHLDGTGWALAGLVSGGTGAGSVALFRGLRNSFQLFGPDGQPAGPRRIVGRRDPCSDARPICETVAGIAMNGVGEFAVIWSLDNTEEHALAAQLFDSKGLPIGERIKLDPTEWQSYSIPAVLTDDGVLAYLINRKNEAGETGLYLRLVPLN